MIWLLLVASPDGLLIGCAILIGVVLGYPGAVAGLAILVALRFLGVRIAAWRAGVIVALLLTGAIHHPDLDQDRSAVAKMKASDRAAGVVESIPVARPGGDRMIIRVREARVDGEWIAVDNRVLAYMSEGAQATVGDTVEVVWTFTPVDSMPPGIGGFTISQNAVGSAQVWSIQVTEASRSPKRFLVDLRRSVSTRIQHLVPGDAGALMSGIVTGDDSALSPEARDAFQASGTSHITAVSGSNVAMLLALWGFAIRRRTRRHSFIVQSGIILSIWIYCAATGLEASALRAATVATLIVLSGRFGRRADPMTILLIASAGLLLWNPQMIGSIGFWLSVVASAALVSNFASHTSTSWQSDVRATLLGLVAVQFATLPLLVWTFGVWSPIGVLANILISPVMIIAFPATFLFAALSYLPLVGGAMAFVPAMLADLTLSIVERLAPVLPPIFMEALGGGGVVLVAIPCLAVVMLLNVDVRRWWPRWVEAVRSRPQIAFASSGGFALGVVSTALFLLLPF